jgi:DNA-binding transcriptional MerR regulator
MAEYRIDDLARAAGTTVRNVRLYQERGLLPPPERRGRVGIYTEAHLARLRLIAQLLERGYTYANIAELVSAWEHGRDLADVLGLEAELTGFWSDEIPDYATLTELRKLFSGKLTPALIRRALKLGVIEVEGRRFRIPSPRLLHAGAELADLGIPLDLILDIFDQLQRDLEENARRLVQSVAGHILRDRDPDWLPSGAEIPELAALIHRLRPLAQGAVDAQLARSMERQVRNVLGDRLAQVLLSRTAAATRQPDVPAAWA